MLMRNKLQDTTYRTHYGRQLFQQEEHADEISDMHKSCKACAVGQMEKPPQLCGAARRRFSLWPPAPLEMYVFLISFHFCFYPQVLLPGREIVKPPQKCPQNPNSRPCQLVNQTGQGQAVPLLADRMGP